MPKPAPRRIDGTRDRHATATSAEMMDDARGRRVPSAARAKHLRPRAATRRFRTCAPPASCSFLAAQIDAWIAGEGLAPAAPAKSRPARSSRQPRPAARLVGARIALWARDLAGGSRAAIDALARGDATAAAIHWLDDATGDYNVALVRETLAGADVVALEWATTLAGLLVAEGNPMRIRRDRRPREESALRIATRQPAPAVTACFCTIFCASGVDRPASLRLVRNVVAHAETELAAIVRDGHADVGLGIEAAARAQRSRDSFR
jgi:hypothetical protein